MVVHFNTKPKFKQHQSKDKQFENATIQKKSDQLVVKEVYLQIVLSLKSIFNILLPHKINF